MNFFTNIYKTAKATISGVQKWKAFADNVKPHRSFADSHRPEAFNYSSLDAWASHPEKRSKDTFTPPGLSVAKDPKVDVFFIHPTTYFGQDNWNQPIGYNPSTELVDEMVVPGMATVFNGSCRLYAPRYRQATFYVFLKSNQNSANALDFAYQDIVGAFDHYLKNHNQGRPFIIAGHSQGSLHTVRLLEEKIEPSPALVQQMVAAYPIGFQLPSDKFVRAFKRIKPSAAPTDLHSIVAWDTFGQGARPKNPVDRCRYFYQDNGEWELRYKKKNFGINPLSMSDTLGSVDFDGNLGAVHVEYDGPFRYDSWWSTGKIGINAIGLSAPQKGEVSAELKEDRFVYISEPKNRRFKMAVMPGKNYHNYDYSLFYMNLRKNIADRIAVYFETK